MDNVVDLQIARHFNKPEDSKKDQITRLRDIARFCHSSSLLFSEIAGVLMNVADKSEGLEQMAIDNANDLEAVQRGLAGWSDKFGKTFQ